MLLLAVRLIFEAQKAARNTSSSCYEFHKIIIKVLAQHLQVQTVWI